MPNWDRFKPHLPLLCAFLGNALLIYAWRIPSLIAWHYQIPVFYVIIFLWINIPFALLVAHIYPRCSKPFTARCALVLALFVLSVIPFRTDQFRWGLSQTLAIIGMCGMVWGVLRYEAMHPALRFLGSLAAQHRRINPTQFRWLAFVIYLATTIFFSWYCFDFHPAYTDSTAQYVHGKFVAAGHLFYAASHPAREFFYVWMMVHSDKWYSQYPPMHQTLLGIGHMLSAPWLINPLEGSLTMLLVYAVAKRAYGESTARLASLLMWLCPFVVLMSSEFMNHSSALFFTTLLMFCYGKCLDAKKLGEDEKQKLYFWALAVGLSAGCAFLSRPLTAIGTSAPFMIHALYCLRKNPKPNLKPFALMALGGGVCILFQMWFNYETTDNMFVYAYTRYHANSLAGAMGYYKEGTLFKTLLKTHSDWFWLNINMFEWSVPSAFFIMLLALRNVKNLTTKLLLGVLVTQSIGNMFNQFTSLVFGPRYMFEISSAFVILVALSIRQIPLTLRSIPMRLPDRSVTQGMLVLVMFSVIATGLVNHIPNKIKDFTHFFDSHPQFIRSLTEQSEHPALIFVGRYDEKKKPSDPAAKFRWTAWTNPPMDDAPVIFAGDRGDKANMKLIKLYPNRKAYIEFNDKLIPVAGTPLNDFPTEAAKP